MRSRPPEPAALNATYRRPNPIDRSQQRHPVGVSLTVGQTEPGRQRTSSLFDGGLDSRILSSGEETLRRHGPSTEVPA